MDPKQNIEGYPWVNHYKYLGTMLNQQMQLSCHTSNIMRKINFITSQMTPVRLRSHFRLNVNLFMTLIMPLFRLGFVLYNFVSGAQQKHFEKMMRKSFKQFIGLPQSFPSYLITALIGNIEHIAVNT